MHVAVAVWSDRSVWIPSHFDALGKLAAPCPRSTHSLSAQSGVFYLVCAGNIWFFSTRVLPLYTANMYREQWELPPMQDVLLFADEHKTRHSW